MAKKQTSKIVGLPLSEDYREGGIEYDPSQLVPRAKKEAEQSEPEVEETEEVEKDSEEVNGEGE